MREKNKTFVILTPGFAESESDTVCIPPIQSFILSIKQFYPSINIFVIAFQYPHKKGKYIWNNVPVYCAQGKDQKGLYKIRTWIRVLCKLFSIHNKTKIDYIQSFWLTECGFIGQHFSNIFKIKHATCLMGQDAKKENIFLRYVNLKKLNVIAISEKQAQTFYSSTGYCVQKTIPLGFDPQKTQSISQSRSIDILGVGSLIPLKNYSLFIDIVFELKKDFPTISSCILGKGIQRDILVNKIEEYKIEGNITMIGEVPHERVLQYMQKSKILLHTSSYEGQSTVMMEALSAGLNVVCFDVGRFHVKDKIYVCNSKEEMIFHLKKLLVTSLTYTPIIPITMDTTVRKFMEFYGLLSGKIETTTI